MKIKFVLYKVKKEELIDTISNNNFQEVDEDYDILVHDFSDQVRCYQDNEMFEIGYDNIIYFESYGNDVYLTTKDGSFLVKDRLYTIEAKFYSLGFLRVNKSFVINLKMIKSIYPCINTKFLLTMKNGNEIDVTRTYYYKFKEKLGI